MKDRPAQPSGPAKGHDIPRERFIARDLRLVHEDDDLLVVDKPSGMLSASLPGQKVREPTLFDLVKRYVKSNPRRRVSRVWIIHRLDKEVSGLMVFAKTEKAFSWLKEDLRAKRVHRLYAAVVEGEFPVSSLVESTEIDAASTAVARQLPMGTVQSYLYEDAKGIVHSAASPTELRAKGRRESDEDSGEAKLAVTHYRVLAMRSGRSLLQLRLETGRKNQIRAHMLEIKHPVVGDRRYGAGTDPLGRVCLHAAELGFRHPGNGQELRFISPTPPAFLKLVGEKGGELADEVARDRISPAHKTGEPAATAAAHNAPVKPKAPEPPRHAPALSASAKGPPPARQSWEHVADWYDQLLEDRGSDHHENVILPGSLRLLDAKAGERVLDVACGQGILCRRLADIGVRCVGVDSSPALIAAAERMRESSTPSRELTSFRLGDARELGEYSLKDFDAAACVMALMNINPLEPVLKGVASSLRPGGRFVAVILHPAFRAPGQTSWGWDAPPSRKAGRDPRDRSDAQRGSRQYRRVDGYLSHGVRDIVMNPGEAARGGAPVHTQTHHRPIQAYIKAMAEAGLLVDALEEWPSMRVSEPGPRAVEENRARKEIPMFLALRARRVSGG